MGHGTFSGSESGADSSTVTFPSAAVPSGRRNVPVIVMGVNGIGGLLRVALCLPLGDLAREPLAAVGRPFGGGDRDGGVSTSLMVSPSSSTNTGRAMTSQVAVGYFQAGTYTVDPSPLIVCNHV